MNKGRQPPEPFAAQAADRHPDQSRQRGSIRTQRLLRRTGGAGA